MIGSAGPHDESGEIVIYMISDYARPQDENVTRDVILLAILFGSGA